MEHTGVPAALPNILFIFMRLILWSHRHDKTRRSLSCFKKKPPVCVLQPTANASNAPSGLQGLPRPSGGAHAPGTTCCASSHMANCHMGGLHRLPGAAACPRGRPPPGGPAAAANKPRLLQSTNLPKPSLLYGLYHTPIPLEMQQFFSFAASFFGFCPCIFPTLLVKCLIEICIRWK